MKKRVPIMIATAAFAFNGSLPAWADDCSSFAKRVADIDFSKSKDLTPASRPQSTYKALYDACDATDTFGGKATPRKCSTDANRVEFLKVFPDGTIVFMSKLGVDADGSPAAKAASHSQTDQPETSLRYPDGTSINAEDVPFIVIPGPSPKLPPKNARVSFPGDTGVKQGDLAAAFHGEHCSLALVADSGPFFRLGEGSLRLQEDLGNPQCASNGEHPCMHIVGHGNGRGIPSGVLTIIFPHHPVAHLTPGKLVHDVADADAGLLDAFLRKWQRHP